MGLNWSEVEILIQVYLTGSDKHSELGQEVTPLLS